MPKYILPASYHAVGCLDVCGYLMKERETTPDTHMKMDKNHQMVEKRKREEVLVR